MAIPDPREDFNGFVDAIAKNVMAEIEGMTEDERAEHFLMKSIEHAIKVHELDAPDIIIKMANKSLHRHLNKLRDRARERRRTHSKEGE